jgi:hypothetical protein
MKMSFRFLVTSLATASVCLLTACSSTRKDSSPPTGSNDILDLLTGFGESVSKRDYSKAVGYLVPEERAQLIDSRGQVPEEKQKALSSLRLARLIRMPGVRVENGYLAGIYDLLPLDQAGGYAPEGYADPALSQNSESLSDSAASEMEADSEGQAEGEMASGEEDYESFANSQPSQSNPKQDLTKAVNKFFKAVAEKNWQTALSMMNENERKILLDDKGRIKEASKTRLKNIDTNGKEALILQDGKLTGVTLLLPAD